MKLYGYRNGRTLRALWALEEVRAEYEYVEVDLFRGEGREPWFAKINPAAKVPVLDDTGTIITESAAICMHLAEKHPESGLLPPGRNNRPHAVLQVDQLHPHRARCAALDDGQAPIRPSRRASRPRRH